MQAELRLSVGEHSLLDTYRVFTNWGEQPRKGDLTQLGSGSADTLETLYCPSKSSLANTQSRSVRIRVRGLRAVAHEAKNGGFRPESALLILDFADKTPSRLSRGGIDYRQIIVLVKKTQAEIERAM
jgi:hypothetical protein